MVQERRDQVSRDVSGRYRSYPCSLRYTVLYCGNLISNAFGQLIAAGVLANMKGTLGHAAWRWLFFSETKPFRTGRHSADAAPVEGALTMFFALVGG